MHNHLDLRRFLILPGRRLVGLRGVVRNGFGVISGLTAILSKHKVTLCQAFVYSVGYCDNRIYGNTTNFSNDVNSGCCNESNKTIILAFLDITKADLSFEEIVSELKSTGYFVTLEVIRPLVEGLIADTLSHPLMAGHNRIIILRDLGYRGLLTEIRKLFGTGGEALLYHVGFTTGIEFAKLHREMAEAVGLKEPADIFNKVSVTMFQWAGFGKMYVKELSNEQGEIVLEDSFECELGKERAITYSQFVRGIMAGILAELFGKGFNVVEEECIAKGDPVCRFRLKTITLRGENHSRISDDQ